MQRQAESQIAEESVGGDESEILKDIVRYLAYAAGSFGHCMSDSLVMSREPTPRLRGESWKETAK